MHMKKRRGWVFVYIMTIAAVVLAAQWGSRAVTVIAENADEAVALGTGLSLQNMETIQNHVRAKNPYQNAIQNNSPNANNYNNY